MGLEMGCKFDETRWRRFFLLIDIPKMAFLGHTLLMVGQ
jgi:hypothetical protein